MKAIHQIIEHFRERGRLSRRQLDDLTAKGYWGLMQPDELRSVERKVGQSFSFEVTGNGATPQPDLLSVAFVPSTTGGADQAIYTFEDFRSRGMPVIFHQECHDGIALRSAPQAAAFQRLFNGLEVHE